jgi:HMG (high mobility group) box
MIPKLKMPLAYDQNLISASSSSGFQIDVLPEGHHHSSGQPALIDPDDLPADPKHAVWALAAAATTHQQKRLPQKSSFNASTLPHSHQPPGTPTISTFSASNLGHIHIVQPYLPSASDITSNPTDSAGGNPALSHGCSTSTFSVHPTSASTPYSFSNPYCTNQLHGLIPGMGAGPGGPGQPPRPANAWILYRSDKMKDIAPSLPGQPKPPQADISKLIAAMWKGEKPEVRQRYEALSDIKKAEHLALYPGYRFQPMKKADREKVRAERKAEKEKERLAAAVKGHRRPKPKRATTEETVATEDNDAENRQEQQGHSANLDVTSPLSPTRMRTFAYQPYSVPSPSAGSPSATLVGAIPKRKRTRTKVENPAPVLPSDEQVSLKLHYPSLL